MKANTSHRDFVMVLNSGCLGVRFHEIRSEMKKCILSIVAVFLWFIVFIAYLLG